MDPRPEAYLFKENAQRRRLRRKTNKIVNFPLERLSQPCKFFLPNPPPLLQISVDFVLRQEVQKLFLHLLHQSSEFYLRLQSSCFFRKDFHFKLIKLVEKVHHWIEDFCHFLEKMSLARWFWVFLKKNLFFGVWKNPKMIVTSFFRCIFDRQDVSW